MAEGSSNLGDLFGMLGGTNPITAVGKSVEQFRRAIDDLLRAVEVFTDTMDTLNTVAGRVNRLLDDVEEPIRTIVPQITATVRLADGLVNQLADPVQRVTPLIGTVADALSTPTFGRLPDQLGEFLDALGDVSRRLVPLGQMLDSAGGLFRMGPLKSLLGVAALPDTAPPAAGSATPPPPPPPPPTTSTAAKPTAPTQTAGKQTAAKTTAAKKTAAKTTAAKKTAAKKTAAKKTAAKMTAAKKTAAKKTAARKTAAKQAAATKTATKRATT